MTIFCLTLQLNAVISGRGEYCCYWHGCYYFLSTAEHAPATIFCPFSCGEDFIHLECTRNEHEIERYAPTPQINMSCSQCAARSHHLLRPLPPKGSHFTLMVYRFSLRLHLETRSCRQPVVIVSKREYITPSPTQHCTPLFLPLLIPLPPFTHPQAGHTEGMTPDANVTCCE